MKKKYVYKIRLIKGEFICDRYRIIGEEDEGLTLPFVLRILKDEEDWSNALEEAVKVKKHMGIRVTLGSEYRGVESTIEEAFQNYIKRETPRLKSLKNQVTRLEEALDSLCDGGESVIKDGRYKNLWKENNQ